MVVGKRTYEHDSHNPPYSVLAEPPPRVQTFEQFPTGEEREGDIIL